MWVFITVLALTLFLLADRADAHTSDELDAWLYDWAEQADVALSPVLLLELADMRLRHPCWTECKAEAPKPLHLSPEIKGTPPLAPAAIRALMEAYFLPQYVNDALSVAWCESKYDPDAAHPRSSARGLFQHLARYWPERSVAAGWAGASILDPEANVAVAAWLSNGGADWSHWVCKPL